MATFGRQIGSGQPPESPYGGEGQQLPFTHPNQQAGQPPLEGEVQDGNLRPNLPVVRSAGPEAFYLGQGNQPQIIYVVPVQPPHGQQSPLGRSPWQQVHHPQANTQPAAPRDDGHPGYAQSGPYSGSTDETMVLPPVPGASSPQLPSGRGYSMGQQPQQPWYPPQPQLQPVVNIYNNTGPNTGPGMTQLPALHGWALGQAGVDVSGGGSGTPPSSPNTPSDPGSDDEGEPSGRRKRWPFVVAALAVLATAVGTTGYVMGQPSHEFTQYDAVPTSPTPSASSSSEEAEPTTSNTPTPRTSSPTKTPRNRTTTEPTSQPTTRHSNPPRATTSPQPQQTPTHTVEPTSRPTTSEPTSEPTTQTPEPTTTAAEPTEEPTTQSSEPTITATAEPTGESTGEPTTATSDPTSESAAPQPESSPTDREPSSSPSRSWPWSWSKHSTSPEPASTPEARASDTDRRADEPQRRPDEHHKDRKSWWIERIFERYS